MSKALLATGFIIVILLFIALSSEERFVVQLDLLQGIWQQEGYGRVVEITHKKVAIYHVSTVSCDIDETFSLKHLALLGEVKHLDQTSLTMVSGINEMDFIRLDRLPDICRLSRKKDKKNALYNFESLWHTFKEQYCSFEKRGVNWEEVYQKYRPQVTSDMSDIDLYLVLQAMTIELGDSHVWIELVDELEKVYLAKKTVSATKESLKTSNETLEREAQYSVLNQYVNEYKEYNKGVLRWGEMKNGIVYLQINAMEGWADFKINPELDEKIFWDRYSKKESKLLDPESKNITGARKVLDRIVDEFKEANAFILDIRFNDGGFDEVALDIMSHFSQGSLPIFTKKARKGNGYTRTLTVTLEPSEKLFAGNVYVLTSSETASAAEIMSLAARAMPNVQLVGAATEGVLSDMLEKQLPNGWEYSLSNEVYETMEGLNFEGVGVPPDHKIKYRRCTRGFLEDIMNDLDSGGDAAIKKVIVLQN